MFFDFGLTIMLRWLRSKKNLEKYEKAFTKLWESIGIAYDLPKQKPLVERVNLVLD